MEQQRNITTKHLFICFAVLSIVPLFLIFSESVWFDETFTLALIQHDFNDIMQILKSDMHPPLYFISLKAFCSVFGYSIVATKLFSYLAYILTVLLGPTLVKSTFSSKSALVYMICIGATPLYYYFATQQRSYSYCILFVTLTFIFAVRILRNYKITDALGLAFSGLLASYNHLYALLACGVIFAIVNIFVVFKNIKQVKTIFIADLIIILGYLPQLSTLLFQVNSASSDFWLRSVEPLSVIVFLIGVLFSVTALIISRKFEVLMAIISIMALQAIGLCVTIFIRPLYIARYCVVVLGIFAILLALIQQTQLKKVIVVFLCVLNIGCLVFAYIFEFNSSLLNFVERFDNYTKTNEKIVYVDTSFGIISYYFPENRHICTYNQEWFEAFDNVDTISPDDLTEIVDEPSWLIKTKGKKIPKYITQNYIISDIDSFRSDFNEFTVHRIIPKK